MTSIHVAYRVFFFRVGKKLQRLLSRAVLVISSNRIVGELQLGFLVSHFGTLSQLSLRVGGVIPSWDWDRDWTGRLRQVWLIGKL